MSSDQIISIGHIDRWADTREEYLLDIIFELAL